jgi:cold shock CspA family protein
MRGRIVGVAGNRKSGFIRGDGETFDRMFHGGSVPEGAVPLRDLEENDVVEFEPLLHSKGHRAASVRLVVKAEGDVVPASVYLEDQHAGQD